MNLVSANVLAREVSNSFHTSQMEGWLIDLDARDECIRRHEAARKARAARGVLSDEIEQEG